MRIGINCLSIDPNYSGGLNTYTLGLLDGLAVVANGHRFRLFVTETNEQLFARYASHPNFDTAVVDHRSLVIRKGLCRAMLLFGSPRLYKLTSGLVYENFRSMMDAESDIVYTPTPALQCFNNRKPTVLSMHDIQHLHYPEFLDWSRRLSRTITYGLSAQYANYFQASSHFIKRDMLAHYPQIAPEQIQVIPEGVNASDFSRRQDTSSLETRHCLPERFLFYPAQLWPHKNHMTVLRALKQLETNHGLRIPLVLTGAKFSAAEEILGFIADQSMDYVHYWGKVPFEDLVLLYQRAAFLITAVLYESSSLPVLEAAAAGTPIIASRTPPNEELARVLQLNLFDPLDSNDLARLILSVWEDEKAISAQVRHNCAHIGHYSWENAARMYIRLFETIENV